MHFLVNCCTALFHRPSNREKISPSIRCLSHEGVNDYDSFMWTVMFGYLENVGN